MKKVFVLCIGLLLFASCSSDDCGDSFVPSASDITITIDENPTNGFGIGTVTTNITGTITYSITSQTIANALTINSTTGAVTVNDASLFDFETNTALNAVISVTNSTDTATATISVTLNDIDDIAFFLSTSSAGYTAAAAGDWITITEEEYDLLATLLNEVSKAGATDQHYEMSTTLFFSGNATLVNTTQPSMPTGSLLFAFKYVPNYGDDSGTKIKLSTTSPTQGYMDVGTVLPSNNQGSSGSLYYLLKGNNSPTEMAGYLCIYSTEGMKGVHSIAGQETVVKAGDYNDLSDGEFNDGWVFFYQGLSSTQKQWD